MRNPDSPTAASAGDADAALSPEAQRATLVTVVWRLLPLLFLGYTIAYIDRINVGFAKLQMRGIFGMDESSFDRAYGLGAGLFFIGYFLFEVPSNLVLQRVGARLWIARIMIVWGLVSMAFMFLHSATMFYLLRFLLGAAEAGFFPGVILYLTYWFPARERARTLAVFIVGGVFAGVVGSPISGALLRLHGVGGLEGWQWLFLLEGVPAVLLGLVVLVALPNRPTDARWLSPAQQKWILARLDEATPAGPASSVSLMKIFTNRRVWLLCLLYFLLNAGGYGYELWLPSIIKSFSATQPLVIGGRSVSFADPLVIGIVNAIPYFAAGIMMLLVARHSDRTGARRGVVALAALISAIGFGLSAWLQNPGLALLALTLAFIGLKCTIAPFWAMATAFLGSTSAAAGIAFINSVGNLGGWAGPHLVGVIKSQTGNNVVALLALGTALLAMAILTLAVPRSLAMPVRTAAED